MSELIKKAAKIIHDDISLKESPVNDADRKLAGKVLSLIKIRVDCPECEGKGIRLRHPVTWCPTCKGMDSVIKSPESGDRGTIL